MSARKSFISFWRSTRYSVRFFLGMLCCFIPSGLYSQQIFGSLIDRFKGEAPEAWKIVESVDDTTATMKIHTKMQRLAAGKMIRSEEKSFLLRRKPGYRLLEALPTKGPSYIFGQNPQYSFKLARDEGKESWLLDKLVIKGDKGNREFDWEPFELLKPNSFSLIKKIAPSFPKLVSDARLKVVRAETVDANLIRVHIQTTIPVESKAFETKGWLVLDPSNAWALQRCELYIISDPVGKMTLVGNKKYSSAQVGVYHPCESWEFTVRTPDDFEAKEEARFESVDSSVPPSEIFSLSYYGLPEPMGVKLPERSRTWLWLLAATIVLAVLAVLFAWLKRRHAASQANVKSTTRSENSP